MKRRIFGLENEYGLTCTLNGQRRLSPDNVARYLFEKVIPGARNANVFLENGARLYLDTGFHPEYATPECDDVAEHLVDRLRIPLASPRGRACREPLELGDQSLQLLVASPIHQREPAAELTRFARGRAPESLILLE